MRYLNNYILKEVVPHPRVNTCMVIVFTSVCVRCTGPSAAGDLGVFCLASVSVNCVTVAGMLMISFS